MRPTHKGPVILCSTSLTVLCPLMSAPVTQGSHSSFPLTQEPADISWSSQSSHIQTLTVQHLTLGDLCTEEG